MRKVFDKNNVEVQLHSMIDWKGMKCLVEQFAGELVIADGKDWLPVANLPKSSIEVCVLKLYPPCYDKHETKVGYGQTVKYKNYLYVVEKEDNGLFITVPDDDKNLRRIPIVQIARKDLEVMNVKAEPVGKEFADKDEDLLLSAFFTPCERKTYFKCKLLLSTARQELTPEEVANARLQIEKGIQSC